MVSGYPYNCALTAAPQFTIQPSTCLGRFKKLIGFLLLFFVFTEATFAAENRIQLGKVFADESFGGQGDLQGHDDGFKVPITKAEAAPIHEDFAKRSDNEDWEAIDMDSDGRPCYRNKVNPDQVLCGSIPPPPPTYSYPTPNHPNQPFSLDPVPESDWETTKDWTSIYGSRLLSHEQRIVEAVAQEFFFHDSEVNFYDARSWEWFHKWAAASEAGFKKERKNRPKLSVITYFAEQKLLWYGLECDENGCRNMPTSDHVRHLFYYRHHEARHVLNTLKTLEKSNNEVHQYKDILTSAKEDLERWCGNFSRIFFHGATKGKKLPREDLADRHSCCHSNLGCSQGRECTMGDRYGENRWCCKCSCVVNRRTESSPRCPKLTREHSLCNKAGRDNKLASVFGKHAEYGGQCLRNRMGGSARSFANLSMGTLS
ncbi:hypothetical protein EJ02DRAFT_20793 [Clathrospora elynae]|uniref:Uncharacterized protein n=1 Tax=Clathrospora elynae TaxID=706981 RepID=A0A6A5SD31_9PLEO|nr:hypothetical protein EJ02DRAFT_20793 [Clathrospora elynae]